jgi:hypothetical protein
MDDVTLSQMLKHKDKHSCVKPCFMLLTDPNLPQDIEQIQSIDELGQKVDSFGVLESLH